MVMVEAMLSKATTEPQIIREAVSDLNCLRSDQFLLPCTETTTESAQALHMMVTSMRIPLIYQCMEEPDHQILLITSRKAQRVSDFLQQGRTKCACSHPSLSFPVLTSCLHVRQKTVQGKVLPSLI